MRKLFIRIVIIAIFILQVADAACTAYGVTLGCVQEGNVLFEKIMHSHPILTAGLVVLCCRLDAVRNMAGTS
jgi:hypothetical protein